MIRIEHSCPDIHKRPRISYEVLVTIASAYNAILKKYNFDKGVYIGVSLDDERYLYLEGGDYYVTAPELLKKMNVYSFTAMIPYNKFSVEKDVVSLYVEALSNCTKEALKKIIQANNLNDTLEQIHNFILDKDWTQFPYPAPFEVQRYVEDTDPMVKEIYIDRYGY